MVSNQTPRKRELAKKDKHAVKNEKRTQKKPAGGAARAGADSAAARSSAARTPVTQTVAASNVRSLAARAFIRRMNKTP